MQGFFEWMLESSLLVIMILGIRRIFIGRIRYSAIYSLWLIVLLRFIIPFNFIPAPINIGNVFSDIIMSGISVDIGYGSGKTDNLYGISLSDMENGGLSGVYSSAHSEKETDYTVSSKPEISRRGISGRMLLCCSVVVSSVLFLWITASNICMNIKMKKCRIFYGRRNGVNIYTLRGIKNPCLYGFLRPAIYIPEYLVSQGDRFLMTGRVSGGIKADSEEIEQIITHEYVHFLHKDHIWAMLRIILLSVYWFHPFLWAAVLCSKRDAELFCDEAVVGRIGEEKRISYGEMLVRLAQDARWGDFRYSMSPMSRSGKEMERRIRAISSRRRYSGWRLIPLVLAALLSLGITCGTGAAEKNGGVADVGIKKPELFVNDSKYNSGGTNVQHTGVINDGVDGQTEADGSDLQSNEEEKTSDIIVFSYSYEQAFSNYINVFTEAVNTGNTDMLQQVLVFGSEVYEQQSNIAVNYYNRGIREEVKSYSIVSANIIEDNQVEINSKEKIKVYYADGTSKIVRQEYKYTCEKIDGNWIITKMSDIDKISV